MSGEGKISIFIAVVVCSMAQLSMGIMSKMTPLKKVAYAGNLAEVKRLVEEGTNANGELQHGFTPLHWAILQGNIEVAEFLISSGADIDSYRTEPHVQVVGTPLHCSAYKGDIKLASLLVSKGADVNASHPIHVLGTGGTALHEAVRSGSQNMVIFLIAKGADINAKARRNQTPLHLARDEEIAGLLIENGADLNAPDKDGWTALDYAADNQSREVANLLAKKGAKVTLHTAAYIGDLSGVRNFVERGIDINAKGFRDRTALHFAVNANIAQLLITKGADVNVGDAYNLTPLHEAARSGQRDVVEVLIAHGADINAKDRWGGTPAQATVRQGYKDVLLGLIAAGVDLKQDGPVLLFTAASSGRKDITGYLIASGVEVDTKADNSYTPMHIAVFLGHKDVVELLVANGADVNTQTDDWSTPLHTAAVRGHKEMIELLVSQGADVNARNRAGLTPLGVAEKTTSSNGDVKKLLRKFGAH